MSLISHIHDAAPAGKAVVWIGGTIVTSFLAGVGWMTSTSKFADAVDQVPVMMQNIENNTLRLNDLEHKQDLAVADRERILCLVTLTATGEQVNPLEVAERCP